MEAIRGWDGFGVSAASHAAELEKMELSALQPRLRHGSGQSTLRYSKHARYLAELDKVDSRVADWSDLVLANLGPLLAGERQLTMPSFITRRPNGGLALR